MPREPIPDPDRRDFDLMQRLMLAKIPTPTLRERLRNLLRAIAGL
jgi:hypothetical protein